MNRSRWIWLVGGFTGGFIAGVGAVLFFLAGLARMEL
jgi:hypothetical protein